MNGAREPVLPKRVVFVDDLELDDPHRGVRWCSACAGSVLPNAAWLVLVRLRGLDLDLVLCDDCTERQWVDVEHPSTPDDGWRVRLRLVEEPPAPRSGAASDPA